MKQLPVQSPLKATSPSQAAHIFFPLLLLGVGTSDHSPPLHPALKKILLHFIHEHPLWSFPFAPARQLHVYHPLSNISLLCTSKPCPPCLQVYPDHSQSKSEHFHLFNNFFSSAVSKRYICHFIFYCYVLLSFYVLIFCLL